MINIESGPTFSGSRAAPGRSAPSIGRIGAPPGRPSFESFSPKPSFSKPSAETFKSVKPASSLKLENKLASSINKDQKFTPQVRFNFIRPLSSENINALRNVKSPEQKLATPIMSKIPKGTERFAQPIIRTQVPDVFYKAFNEKPPEIKMAAPKGSREVAQALKPETLIRNFQKVEPTKVGEYPKAKSNSFESVKFISMPKVEAQNAKSLKIDSVKSEIEKKAMANKIENTPQKTKTPELPKLIQEQKLLKPEVLIKGKSLIEIKAQVQKVLRNEVVHSTDKKVQTKSVEQFLSPKAETKMSEIKVQPLQQTRKELMAKNIPLTPALSLWVRENRFITQPNARVESTMQLVKKVLQESPRKVSEKIAARLAEQITEQQKSISINQAREMVAKANKEASPTKKIELKIATEVTKMNEQLTKTIKNEEQLRGLKESEQQQEKAKALAEALKKPEIKIKVSPEKRAKALETVKQLTETKEYQLNPKLHHQTKELVKEIERQIVEEKQLIETVTAMKEAGMVDSQIMPIITAQAEAKNLPLETPYLELILKNAEQKATTEIAGTQQLLEKIEREDELDRLLIEIRMLFIELDEKALAERFKTLFTAIEKAYQKALEEGKEYFTGSDIYSEHPQFEEEEEKSELIQGQERGDGGYRFALDQMNNSSIKFFTLEHAYDFAEKILRSNRPGKIRGKVTQELISEEEIRKIFEDRPMPSATTNPTILNPAQVIISH